ncbi:MAG: DUF4331 domain-containing protein [Opitutaceae bacterium]|nr:DUF4331 domain-containing protein [Opitutaceae bacterium]
MKISHLIRMAIPAFAACASFAASHSDAPLSKQDPQTNLTDVYAFIGTKYNDPSIKVLNVIVHVRPFSEPGDGVIYDKFSDDALYSIHIADPNTGLSLRRYDFEFSSVSGNLKTPNTILSYGLGTEVGPIVTVGDARQNYVQTYSVSREDRRKRAKTLANGLLCPPPNVGPETTPAYNDLDGLAVSGATTFEALDNYTKQTVYSAPTGESFFAGSRDDGFFADTPGIFDLLNSRILDNNGTLADGLGQDGNGVDGFKGFNVLAFALQIPVSDLPSIAYTAPFTGAANGVGVYASVSRRRVTVLSDKKDPKSGGPWVQVNRMGNPLFNEVLVALRDKDNYNRSAPTDDAARFRTYALNPEIATLVNALYSTTFTTTGRTDLAAVFIPDVLRVNTATAPVKLAGSEGFSRLSFIGSDTTDGAAGGWPNGRRLGDDVVDIALTAVASGPAYTTITLVGDNMNANDQTYNAVFPYSATPHSGTNNSKDSVALIVP